MSNVSVGDVIKVRGLSKKGKQRVTQWGSEWKIIGHSDNFQGQGHAVLLSPINNPDNAGI